MECFPTHWSSFEQMPSVIPTMTILGIVSYYPVSLVSNGSQSTAIKFLQLRVFCINSAVLLLFMLKSSVHSNSAKAALVTPCGCESICPCWPPSNNTWFLGYPWVSPPSPPQQHFDQFSHFCIAHPWDQHTDRQPMLHVTSVAWPHLCSVSMRCSLINWCSTVMQ